MRALEGHVVDLVHQEIAFPFEDIIHDQAQRSLFKDDLDEGLESWIMGRLQRVKDIDASTRLVLDLIGGFGREIKREEDEVEIALTAASTTYTVAVRYYFFFGLIALLLFLSEDLPQWDPALQTSPQCSAGLRFSGKYVMEQPANDGPTTVHPSTRSVSAEVEDVAARLRTLDVSRGSSSHAPPDTPGHSCAACSRSLGASSPAHAARLEVMWRERLRLMGSFEAARETLGWLSRTPAVMYVWARLWLDIGRDADAAGALDSPGRTLSYEDAEALGALPNIRLFDSYFGLQWHASALFEGAGRTDYDVHFSRLALSVVWPD
ncbi:hypothetical protein BV25DRAFT_1919787 [Artomyces pyxidatus]|uniref:Uncharacterized protein n=1 Tax=Artomyces pyxidatus TaxID=48021 RepID=A0ACB8SP97_9AGAM|nr:hypothetical protein BV25DRAFT_1919787 [Artomyces pyxidatus]